MTKIYGKGRRVGACLKITKSVNEVGDGSKQICKEEEEKLFSLKR